MSGKGETVVYTRLVKLTPTPADKRELKAKITKIIDDATESITIEAMVEATVDQLEEAARRCAPAHL
jgi:CRISPR/Cas system-associated endoribonuclease Cas2